MLKTKIATAIATGALCLTVLAPAAFADTTIDVSGNGSNSTNHVTVTNSTNCTVSQSNVSQISTGVTSTASTGGNQAYDNTNGDVSVTTGDASNTNTVSVTGSMNTATNPCCGCTQGVSADAILSSDGITVDNNGTGTHNKVKLSNTNTTSTGQANVSSIGTSVGSKAKTGKNKANKNTGGSTTVGTGSSTNTTTVTVGGSSNSL